MCNIFIMLLKVKVCTFLCIVVCNIFIITVIQLILLEIEDVIVTCPCGYESVFCDCRYDGLEEGLWLHCFRYTGPEWTYECPYPDWAKLS